MTTTINEIKPKTIRCIRMGNRNRTKFYYTFWCHQHLYILYSWMNTLSKKNLRQKITIDKGKHFSLALFLAMHFHEWLIKTFLWLTTLEWIPCQHHGCSHFLKVSFCMIIYRQRLCIIANSFCLMHSRNKNNEDISSFSHFTIPIIFRIIKSYLYDI